MKKIDVCLSPEMIRLYNIEEKIVVVADILRATSCITTGIAHGVQSITPVATVEECRRLQNKGYIAAAERGGQKVEGFDIGNSPFSYMDENLKNKKVAVTTTNGTRAIDLSRDRNAYQIIIGSFLNLKAVKDYLHNQEKDVLVFCAGWKGKFNLEDTLYAGALVDHLQETYQPGCDSALASKVLYHHSKESMIEALSDSSHVKRLKKFNIMKDVEFCLKEDEYDVIPVLNGDQIVKLEKVLI